MCENMMFAGSQPHCRAADALKQYRKHHSLGGNLEGVVSENSGILSHAMLAQL